jgi:hypothetical protein
MTVVFRNRSRIAAPNEPKPRRQTNPMAICAGRSNGDHSPDEATTAPIEATVITIESI